jgi:hypothetical protein
VKVDTLRVVVVVVYITRVHHKVHLVEAVVGMVQVSMGIWVQVDHNTRYHIQVVVVAVQVWVKLRTNTRGMLLLLTAVSWATADAVVRVLCLSKRTLRPQTVVRLQSSRSGTRVDEVYH